MAVIHSPNVVRSGLVMHVDAANVKSFVGEPTTNLVPNPDFSSGTTSWSLYSGGGTTTITAVVVTDAPRTYGTSRNVLQCNTSTTLNGGGTYGGVSQSGYALTAGLSYTVSYYARSLSGTLTVRFGNQTGSGDESNLSHDITVTDAWTKFTRTVTLDLAKSIILIYNKNGSVAGGIFQIADMQIEQKAYATTFVNGTRGTTVAAGGGWADLTTNSNNCTLTNGPTYSSANSGILTFDGTNNYVSFTSPGSYSNYSIEMWVKMGSLTGQQRLYANSGAGTFTVRWDGSDFNFHFNPLDGSPSSVQTSASGLSYSTGTWYHLTATNAAADATTGAKFYVNGALAGTVEPAVAMPASTSRLGSDHTGTLFANCSIALFKIYSSTLTATQITQNFEAQRKRFGI